MMRTATLGMLQSLAAYALQIPQASKLNKMSARFAPRLLRDFVFEVLAPVESDTAAVRLCLQNDDDVGARYHLKRIVECVKAAASTFRELEAMKAAPADARAA